MVVAGVGAAAKFQPGDDEIRFSFRFEILRRADAGQPIQRGVCTLPDGRKLSLTVNDETGTSTPEGDVRVFAGLRSDPFYLAWNVGELKKLPNLLEHTNVLSMVVELDTRRVLDPAKGSLFGAIAETVPISKQRTLLGPPVLRLDWVGRPEQTNIRLNNPAMSGIDDVRDLWNQQTPFAMPKGLQPLFLQRLKDSLVTWDLLDGTADWTPEALAANANVFLDDFLLFDVAKPNTDDSHLEIEKSTIGGGPYLTGGGRTVDASSIDISASPRRAADSKIWCHSAPCWPVWSDSLKRTSSIDKFLMRTTACRRFHWRGSALSSACCGGNSCRYRPRMVPRSGMHARWLTCRAM